MPSGIAEVLAACMEPVGEYETVLGVLKGFTGHEAAKAGLAIRDKCREVLGIDQVSISIDDADTRTLMWGAGRWLTLQRDTINIDWVLQKNYDRIKAMVARNEDRRAIIKAIDQPEMVEIDMMLKQYAELTYKLGQVMAYGTKLFWDKSAIQASYGLGWTLPQKYPF